MFTEELTGKMLRIQCPLRLDSETGRTFAQMSKAWLLKPAEQFVVDFSKTVELTRDFYKPMIQLKTSLRKDQKAIYSVGLNATLWQQVREDGVEAAFNPIKSINEIGMEKNRSLHVNGSLNVDFLNPFLAAIQKTFETQCNTKIQIRKPQLKKGAIPDIAIAGVLSLISDGFSGSIVLCFSSHVFLKIYENMFDEKHDTITAELEDAAGELLNIIYGSAKIELNQKGYDFKKALPTVLVGEKITVRQAGPKPAVIVPVSTDAGEFHVEIEFDNK